LNFGLVLHILIHVVHVIKVIKFLSLPQVLEIEAASFLLILEAVHVVLLLLLHDQISLKLLDEIGAVHIAVCACVGHAVLIESFVFSNGLHTSEVAK